MTNPRYIGVDIGGTNIRAARFAGEAEVPEAKVKVPTEGEKGFDVVLNRLEHAVREAADDGTGPASLARVAGVGIAAPGPIDPRAGVVIRAPNLPGWSNLPLRHIMEQRLGRPVFIGNDANLAALGEWKFGAGRGHDDVLYLTISTGIGSGIITGGQMLVGTRGLAGEVGHMLAVPDGPLCGCGLRGHLEAVASGTALAREARQRLAAGEGAGSAVVSLVGGDLGHVTGAIVGAAAQAGDAFALALVTQAGHYIGRTLASLMHALNPSIVIFGGGVSALGDVLLDPVREAVREYAMSDVYWRNCPIVLSALGDDAGLIGAGVLAMEAVRNPARTAPAPEKKNREPQPEL